MVQPYLVLLKFQDGGFYTEMTITYIAIVLQALTYRNLRLCLIFLLFIDRQFRA